MNKYVATAAFRLIEMFLITLGLVYRPLRMESTINSFFYVCKPTRTPPRHYAITKNNWTAYSRHQHNTAHHLTSDCTRKGDVIRPFVVQTPMFHCLPAHNQELVTLWSTKKSETRSATVSAFSWYSIEPYVFREMCCSLSLFNGCNRVWLQIPQISRHVRNVRGGRLWGGKQFVM